MPESQPVLLDAGVLIGALLRGDLRHSEARPLVEAARRGVLPNLKIATVEEQSHTKERRREDEISARMH